MSESRDIALALQIHQKLNSVGITENAILPENVKDGYQPRTLIDQTLELIDPTPNIFTLFIQFNAKYFWNKLSSVEVKWSKRMTTCAGTCSFHPRNRQCTITLSAALLKLRPRKDLVETLLHEMIHGFLFLTNNDKDRDGHGPEFHKHMYRINREAGTNITVYHNFHDEVRLYQQHWWRCNGPCQKNGPYFGMVRRAMNRAPGPSDNWWSKHQRICNGQFIKVREPEKAAPKTKKELKNKTNVPLPKSKTLQHWFPKDDKSPVISQDTPKVQALPSLPATEMKNPRPVVNGSQKTTSNKSIRGNPSDFAKLGNASNNIHGWGVGGPGRTPSASKIPNATPSNKVPRFNAGGTLGGIGTGRSNLLDKFTRNVETNRTESRVAKIGGGSDLNSRKSAIRDELFNKRKSNEPTEIVPKIPKLESLPERTNCPVCNVLVRISKLNNHLDECLSLMSINNDSTSEKQSTDADAVIDLTSPAKSESPKLPSVSLVEPRSRKCLVCTEMIDPNVRLEDHLEACIGSAFMDESTGEFTDFEEDDSDAKDKSSPTEFPCPICMTVIEASLMNRHLDECLNIDFISQISD